MKNNIKSIISSLLLLISTNLISQNPVNPYKAPLYWDVYENNYLQEKAGVANNYISESDFLANINWVDTNLKNCGYTMVCVDGWGDVMSYDQYGYRTKHSSMWAHDYAWWSSFLQSKGMTLGIYDNPLWVNSNAANAGAKVIGTNILLSSLINTSENAKWFTWLQVDRPGAKEYVKGCVQHYADMGVKYFRVDFLSWYESGWDRYLGTVGPVRTLANYQTALQWIHEACDANGMFLSLVMPNLNNDGVTEQKYGHMVRIDEDCSEGTWTRFSDNARGVKRNGWSQYANPFDGYSYWSKIAGKGKLILDGDFIRLNTYSNDEERKTVVSLHLMAGGPVSVADQYNTIGNSLWIYQNGELLALNQDGFVGKPLSGDPTNALSQVWKGQMSNGDWIVGFFNRENSSQTRSINLSTDLGLSGNVFVRDLWSHSDVGSVSSLSRTVATNACQVFRISANTTKVASPAMSEKTGTFSGGCIVNLTTSTVGASVFYTLDGTTPSTSSNPFTKAILISSNTVIKAIAVKSGMENSFVSSETYTVSTIAPQAAMFVGGTFNAWNLPANPLTNTGGNNWISSTVALQTGSYQMKFANTSNWTGIDWGNATGLSGTCQITTGGLPNVIFTIPTAGNYTFSFNDAMLNYSINNALTAYVPANNNKIKVNYNSTDGKIYVQLPTNQFSETELINLNGQRIYQGKSSNAEFSISLNKSLVSKIILIHIVSESLNYIEKIIL